MQVRPGGVLVGMKRNPTAEPEKTMFPATARPSAPMAKPLSAIAPTADALSVPPDNSGSAVPPKTTLPAPLLVRSVDIALPAKTIEPEPLPRKMLPTVPDPLKTIDPAAIWLDLPLPARTIEPE